MNTSDFESHFNFLNDAQKDVVEKIYGQIMVVAGPGTGKTQIIGLRTANIILKAGADPENILITTFTEAGVIAIKKRLLQFIGTDAYKVNVSTIHGFAQDVIMSFPEKFSEEKALNTIDDIESLELLTSIIDSSIKDGNIEHLFTAFDRYMYLRDIRDRIGKLKGEGVTPEKLGFSISKLRGEYDQKLEDLKTNKRIRDLEKRTQKDSAAFSKHIGKLTELKYIYTRYVEKLRERSLYDFSDMINFVVEKFREDIELREFYAEKFQFIMIDEYQDTNNPQNEIMDLILAIDADLEGDGETGNIMVVGDDDQSIYRFQGANIENMLDFYSKYPHTQFIVLENNYRSAQSILDLSLSLIENNSQRLVNKLDFLDKKLIAQTEYKNLDNNNYYIFGDAQTEKVFVLDSIKKRLASHSNASIAIIARSNREVESWTHYMQSEGIEVESKLKTNILTNHFVEFILNFLKLIENPRFDDEKFLNILRSGLVDVENIDVITLARELYKKNYSKSGFQLTLWDIIKNIDIDYSQDFRETDENYSFATRQDETFRGYKKIIDFRNFILDLNTTLGTYGVSILFSKIIEGLGLASYVENHGNFSDLEDMFTLFNKIKDLNEKNKDLSLKMLLNKFDLHKKYNIAIPRQILKKTLSNIEVLTAHSSKGLEYDYVYIPGVYAGNWEGKRIIDKLKLPLGVVGDGLQYANISEKEQKNIEKEMSLQEDRRLFFVAVTRAKKEIIFTRPAGKENKPYIDSPFIIEMGLASEMIDSQLSTEELITSINNTLLGEQSLIKTTSEELNYITEFLEHYKLSPTDFNTFLEDPKEFLKNVVFKYPFTGNEFTIFGNVYHKVLEHATMKKINKEEVSLGYITEEFLRLLDLQVLTAEEKNRLTKKGLEGLTGYFEYFKNNKRIPLKNEYNFRSRNVMFNGIPITGKIDKIEKIRDGLNNEKFEGQGELFVEDVAVVDYKTGATKTENKIKGLDRYGNIKDDFAEGKYYRQLLFYKLLAENDPEFYSKFNITELALDFVEGKNGEYSYMPVSYEMEDFENFKSLLEDAWQKINSLVFWKEVLGKEI